MSRGWLVVALIGGWAAPAAAQVLQCPGSFSGTDPLVCICPPGGVAGSVWGSDPYTADSSICTAAVHAGRVTANGGAVQVFPAPAAGAYPGSTANGVTTGSWGAYDRAFTFSPALPNVLGGPATEACTRMPAQIGRHSCACAGGPPVGSVWGSDPYTDDSGICAAAVHAGLIGIAGGAVTVLALPGLEHYAASDSNGVRSSSWGATARAITFDRNAR